MLNLLHFASDYWWLLLALLRHSIFCLVLNAFDAFVQLFLLQKGLVIYLDRHRLGFLFLNCNGLFSWTAFFGSPFTLAPAVVEDNALCSLHASKSIFLAIFPKADVNAAVRPDTFTKAMALICLETTMIGCAITVFEVAFSFKLVLLELSNVERVLLGEFKTTDAITLPIFPLPLVEVAVGPAIDPNAIRLVLIVKSKVD